MCVCAWWIHWDNENKIACLAEAYFNVNFLGLVYASPNLKIELSDAFESQGTSSVNRNGTTMVVQLGLSAAT